MDGKNVGTTAVADTREDFTPRIQRSSSGLSPRSLKVNEEATDSNSTFEDELYWCQRHLEEKLHAKRVSPREAQSILKSLKLLSNSKTPFVKKRQVMRLTCGDYRQAMQKQTKEIQHLIHDSELDHVEDISSGRALRKAADSSTSNETESHAATFMFNFPEPEGGQDTFK